jgi:hypothetical protein
MKYLPWLLVLLATSLFAENRHIAHNSLRLTEEGHVEVYQEGHWTPVVSDGLPLKALYPNYDPQARPFNSLDQHGDLALATTPFGLFRTKDQAKNWELVFGRRSVARYAFFTAVALSPLNTDLVAIGTSSHGIQISRNQGKTFSSFDIDLDLLSFGGNYVDSLTALDFSHSKENVLYASFGFRGIVLEINLETQETKNLDFGPDRGHYISEIEHVLDREEEYLSVRDENRYWRYRGGAWFAGDPAPQRPRMSPEKAKRMLAAADRYGIYVTSYQAMQAESLEAHLDFIQERGFNSIVIDFKDDNGHVTWDTVNPLARSIGAAKDRLDLDQLVQKVHQRGLYLIARVVVFKDPKLWRYANNKYAVWDYTTEKPWGHFIEREKEDGSTYFVQREFWVDTYSEEVWEYNVALAKELEERGVDEIQFDYIRFPSDGPTQNASYRYKKPHMTQMDALESFLIKARRELSIPISTDVFGFNGWYEMDYLGQNVRMISRYVDAISPMLYPSHFPWFFFGDGEYTQKAKMIYQEGSNRTYFMSEQAVHSRPYIQAFLMGPELEMDRATYFRYLEKQLEGVQESFGNGFLLWNNSNRYYMVPESIFQYTNRFRSTEVQLD